MRSVAVVGAGTMGNGIAHVFGQFGWRVTLIDVSPEALERGLGLIGKNLERQVQKGTLTREESEAALARIVTAGDLEAAAGSELVVEAASENPETKFAIFRDLAQYCPGDTILASNTSSISITEIAGHARHPERIIGMHFMNPVPVMKLVEVIRGHHTAAGTLDRVMQLARELDKVPVEVSDYPGFVSNRVLMPMINEAIFCVMEGVATAEAVDTVMKLGMAHPMGPLTLADLIGLDVCLSIMTVLHQGLGDDKYRPCPLLRRMVAAGDLGRKTGRGFYSYG